MRLGLYRGLYEYNGEDSDSHQNCSYDSPVDRGSDRTWDVIGEVCSRVVVNRSATTGVKADNVELHMSTICLGWNLGLCSCTGGVVGSGHGHVYGLPIVSSVDQGYVLHAPAGGDVDQHCDGGA